MSKKTIFIRILNSPTQSYTTQKRAEHLVRYGSARWQGQSIELLPQALQIKNNQEVLVDFEIAYRRAGMVPWNGSDHKPSAFHRPGEVVS